MKLPDFFIVGTMKSGTTILYESICTHPRVVEGLQKEIHFFSLYPYKGLDWYASHFEGHHNGICGDASPTYFDFAYGDTIPRFIKSCVPHSKPIIIVRDPIARAVSHFFHLKKIVKPKWFEEVEINEFFSQSISAVLRQSTPLEWALNQILWCSCYFRKLLYYKEVFGMDNLLVLTNDQLKYSPEETMEITFEHLDLEYMPSDSFGEFKYSTGSTVTQLDRDVYSKLEEILYPDFRKFCSLTHTSCIKEM